MLKEENVEKIERKQGRMPVRLKLEDKQFFAFVSFAFLFHFFFFSFKQMQFKLKKKSSEACKQYVGRAKKANR